MKNHQTGEQKKWVAELIIVNNEHAFQKNEKRQRAAELIIANKELAFQNREKEKRAAELIIANKELIFQNKEKEKRASELIIANKELVFQNDEKEKRAAELIIANKELVFQNDEKEKRAAELIIANKELVFQNDEKEKRAAELIIANKELAFQNDEKEKRAAELIIANKELAFQNEEKEKRETERTKMIGDIVQRNKDLEQFSYIVSHNLRAPVANILGLVDVIQNIGLNRQEEIKTTRYLAIAARNLDNVIMDINTILDLKHNVNEKKEIVVFEELLSQIKFSLDDAITYKMVQITSNFSAVKGMVTLKSYLYSIFYNLITNSIKYKQPGVKPVIDIYSSILKDKIRIVFKDNGLGIDLKKNGKYFFGLYKRFHNHIDGKGMGLYMVKAQVESLGGTITVSSEVNIGTEFRIEFDFS